MGCRSSTSTSGSGEPKESSVSHVLKRLCNMGCDVPKHFRSGNMFYFSDIKDFSIPGEKLGHNKQCSVSFFCIDNDLYSITFTQAGLKPSLAWSNFTRKSGVSANAIVRCLKYIFERLPQYFTSEADSEVIDSNTIKILLVD